MVDGRAGGRIGGPPTTGLILRITPRHEALRGFFDFPGIFEQPGDVCQGICPGKLAGVDQAHEQVPYIGAPLRFIEHRVFPIDNCILQCPFTYIMPTAGLCRVVGPEV